MVDGRLLRIRVAIQAELPEGWTQEVVTSRPPVYWILRDPAGRSEYVYGLNRLTDAEIRFRVLRMVMQLESKVKAKST